MGTSSAAVIAFPTREQPAAAAPAEEPLSELTLMLLTTARTDLAQCAPTALADSTAAGLVRMIEQLRSTLSGLLCSGLPPQTGWAALWEAESVNLALAARGELLRLISLLARAIGRMTN